MIFLENYVICLKPAPHKVFTSSSYNGSMKNGKILLNPEKFLQKSHHSRKTWKIPAKEGFIPPDGNPYFSLGSYFRCMLRISTLPPTPMIHFLISSNIQSV